MLSTNQSTHIEHASQGAVVSKSESKSESKAGSDLPEKSSFSKLFSSMKVATTSEVSVSTASAANTSAVTGEDSAELMAFPQVSESEDVTLSVMQQLPTSGVASDQAGSNLSDGLSLPDSQSAPLSTLQPLPVSEVASNQAGGNLSAELSLPDSQSAPLSTLQPLPVSEIASNRAGGNLSAKLSLPDSQSAPLSTLQPSPASEIASNQAGGNLSAELSLSDSDAPQAVVDEMANPLLTPIGDGSEVTADSELIIATPVVSHNAAENSKVVGDVIVQNAALNQSSVGREHSATVQLNGAVSNAASNSVTSWGTQANTAGASVSGGDIQSGATQSQTFTQGGQSGQSSQGQTGQQQAMMFAQFVKEGKTQAFEQQAAVRAIDESTLKSEVKELLGGAEVASTDRRGQLPLGLQTIQQPPKHPQWGQALGQRVVFMANNSIQQAQITLNPEKLGQIQVTLQFDKDQRVNVSLTAQNGITRESMESALPKLREMLEQAGITPGSMDVSDQKQSSESADDKSTSRGASNSAVEEEGAIIESTLSTVKTTDNIVDYYA